MYILYKYIVLHEIRYAKLFEVIVKWTKIHVQIMRFTCCLHMFFLQYFKWALICLSVITRESVAARIDHYVDMLFAKTLHVVFDVVTT